MSVEEKPAPYLIKTNCYPIEPAWFVDQWKEQVKAMAKML